MRHTVAFTANDRLNYLRETLDSWRLVRGIGDAHLIFHVEPGNPHVLKACRQVDFAAQVTVIENDVRLGPGGNPWQALDTAFGGGAEFAVCAEDDTPVADDILEYFTWACGEYRDDRGVLLACAFQHHRRPGGFGGVVRVPCFYSQVFGTWAGRWRELLRDDWDRGDTKRGGARLGYDWHIRDAFMEACGFAAVYPCESRSQVSGQYGGTHLRPEQFEAHLSDCFSAHYEPAAFREVPAEPGGCGYA
jgi:hypothetical protein